MAKTKFTKRNPTNNTGAEWLVKNRDLNWEVEGAFYTEIEARIFCEEWNSHPDVNREQVKVFGPGA